METPLVVATTATSTRNDTAPMRSSNSNSHSSNSHSSNSPTTRSGREVKPRDRPISSLLSTQGKTYSTAENTNVADSEAEAEVNAQEEEEEGQQQQQQQQQEAMIFGGTDTPQAMSDALAASVQTAISQGVRSLPLVPTAQIEALTATIQQPYVRNIDIIEAYSQQQLFSLRQVAPRRRQRLVQVYELQLLAEVSESKQEHQHEQEQHQQINNHDGMLEEAEAAVAAVVAQEEAAATATATTAGSSSSNYQVPTTKDSVPSPDAQRVLQEEVAQLTVQLEQAHARRTQLLVETASLGAAQKLTDHVHAIATTIDIDIDTESAAATAATTTTTEDGTLSKNAISKNVTAAVMGGQGLQDLTREGTVLQSQLENRRRQQQQQQTGLDEDDNLPPFTAAAPPFKKTRVSPEDAYRLERQAVHTTVDNLSVLSTCLKGRGGSGSGSTTATTTSKSKPASATANY